MRRTIFRIALIIGALAWPFAAFAEPPNVTGITAHLNNGQIAVHWEAPPNGKDITAYRIYYGQKSILGNNGAYDDFVATTAKNTDFIFNDIPPYPKLYLSVLAVDPSGESASFVEEVELDLSQKTVDGKKAGQSSSSAPSPSRKRRETTTLGLLDATADSPISIHLNFSMPVQIPLDRAVDAFRVIDHDGVPLQLKRIVIQGNLVTLTTEPQYPGREYGLRVGDVVTGASGSGANLPLDTKRNMTSFAGYGSALGALSIPPVKNSPKPSPLPGSVITPAEKPSGGLSHSGPGILMIVVAAGAMAGWWKFRRKKLAWVG